MMKSRAILSLVLLSTSIPGWASGVNQYQYDARGRLIKACATTPGTASLASYGLDNADNRSSISRTNPTFGLSSGSGMYSPNGQYYFVMQTDGNLVLYGPSGALWSSNTYGTGASSAAFQSDGNLVVYGPSGALWSSQTGGDYCAHLAVEDSGRVAIYAANGSLVWSTS